MKSIDLSCHQRTRGMVKALGLSVVLLLTLKFNLSAQGLPPLPPFPSDKPPAIPRDYVPRDPAEVERERQEREQRVLAKYSDWLHEGLKLDGGRIRRFDELVEHQKQELETIANHLTREGRESYERAVATKLPRVIEGAGGTRAVLVGMDEFGYPLFYGSQNAASAGAVSTAPLWPGGASGLGLSGIGVTVGQWDEKVVRASHVEFANGRVVNVEPGSHDGHPTHTAGTILGTGVNPLAKGMAFAGHLRARSYDNNTDLGEMTTEAAAGLRLSNHSYGAHNGWFGVGTSGANWIWFGPVDAFEDFKFGHYGTLASALDILHYSAPYYLSVWAAGNERGTGHEGPLNPPSGHFVWDPVLKDVFWVSGPQYARNRPDGKADGYDTLLQQQAAKNILVIGAVKSLPNGYQGPGSVLSLGASSRGPTDDGRVAPHLVAPGENLVSASNGTDSSYNPLSGTSMAAPVVTGSMALLHQLQEQLYGPARLLRASTLKALVIHTADQTGANAGPDYVFGFGLLNTRRAAELMVANFNTPSKKEFIKEIFIPDGGEVWFPFNPAGGGQPVQVTIVWTDPSQGSMPPVLDNRQPVLVNDLDLRVVEAGSIEHEPWVLDPNQFSQPAQTGDNLVDNVEQVLLDPAPQAPLAVRIRHKGTLLDGSRAQPWGQWVSVVISGAASQSSTPLPPVITDLDRVGNQVFFKWAAVVGQTYQVLFKDDLNTAAWQAEPSLGEINALTPEVAVAVPYSAVNPRRFYQVVTVD